MGSSSSIGSAHSALAINPQVNLQNDELKINWANSKQSKCDKAVLIAIKVTKVFLVVSAISLAAVAVGALVTAAIIGSPWVALGGLAVLTAAMTCLVAYKILDCGVDKLPCIDNMKFKRDLISIQDKCTKQDIRNDKLRQAKRQLEAQTRYFVRLEKKREEDPDYKYSRKENARIKALCELTGAESLEVANKALINHLLGYHLNNIVEKLNDDETITLQAIQQETTSLATLLNLIKVPKGGVNGQDEDVYSIDTHVVTRCADIVNFVYKADQTKGLSYNAKVQDHLQELQKVWKVAVQRKEDPNADDENLKLKDFVDLNPNEEKNAWPIHIRHVMTSLVAMLNHYDNNLNISMDSSLFAQDE